MGGFISKGSKGNQGEGCKMIDFNEKNGINLDIRMMMICVAHGGEEGNTINKDRFKDAHMDGELTNLPHFDLLKQILT